MQNLKVRISLIIITALFIFVLLPIKSYAATDSYTVGLTFDPSPTCTSSFSTNGYTGLNQNVKNTFDINSGDTLNVSIINQSSSNLIYSVNNGASVSINTGDSALLSYLNVQSTVQIQAEADPNINICGYKQTQAEITFAIVAPTPVVNNPSTPAPAPVITNTPKATTKVTTKAPPTASTPVQSSATTTPTTNNPVQATSSKPKLNNETSNKPISSVGNVNEIYNKRRVLVIYGLILVALVAFGYVIYAKIIKTKPQNTSKKTSNKSSKTKIKNRK